MQRTTHWPPIAFDWNALRAFIATAEQGSLSAAARALVLRQSTVSRQVAALERALDVMLFERGPRAMQLTATGHDLLAHAHDMADAATRLALAASGSATGIEGRVSLTTTGLFATMHLPAMLVTLRERAPGIAVDIVTSSDVRDLIRREADIAVRHIAPEHGELIGRQCGTIAARIYGSCDYLNRKGRPVSLDDLVTHDFIGFASVERMLPEFHALGLPVTAEQFRYCTESGTAIVAMIEAGLGLSIMTEDVARHHSSLEVVMRDQVSIDVPVWLVTHRELRTSRRIRIVFDLLAESLASLR